MERKLDKDKYHAIRGRMAGLKGKESSSAARLISQECGVSYKYIMEITKDLRPTRAKRSDARARKIKLSQAQELFIIAQVVRCGSSATAALAAATDESNSEFDWYMPAESAPTRQTVDGWLRELNLGYHNRQPNMIPALTPYTRRQATRANELWYLDATVGEQLYLEEDGEHILFVDKTDRKQPKLPHAVIWSAVDAYSRVCFMGLYSHESAVSLCDFVFKAMSRKSFDSEMPFKGIPDGVYSDPGPSIRSRKFQNAAAALKFTVKWHQAKHPWSKGAVERMFRSLIDRQKVMKFAPRWTRTEFANFLLRWTLFYNSRPHSTTGEAPMRRWIKAMNEGRGTLREAPPEALKRFLTFDVVTRNLEPSGMVRLNSREFFIGRDLQRRMAHLVGTPIEILADTQNKDEIYVHHDGEVHLCKAAGIVALADFTSEAGKPPAFSRREEVLAAVNSKETKKMLENIKGVGLPATGPAYKLDAEPISFAEQLEQRGMPSREAIDEYAAREMLIENGLLGVVAENPEISEVLLGKLIAAKSVNGESLYRDEVAKLITEIEKLLADAAQKPPIAEAIG